MQYADGQTMHYRGGVDRVFENNQWHHNDFTCVGDRSLFQSYGVRDHFQIVRNVIHSTGPSVGFGSGSGNAKDRSLGLSIGATVRLNLFYDLKYLQDDGSPVQTLANSQMGIILEYNWGYEMLKWGLRFDCGICNESSSSWGHNGTLHVFNVLWKTRGVGVKGDNQSIHNNLIYMITLTFI